MLTKELDTIWAREFGVAPPIPPSLKFLCRNRWVRFHSLPGSKRYPESPAEVEEVLRRHNVVLERLGRLSPRVFLVTAAYSASPAPVGRKPPLDLLDPAALPWRLLPVHEIEDDPDNPLYWHLFASEWSWRPGIFDALLRLVADDVVADVMLVFDGIGAIYHPYDGGADVIMPTARSRDELAADLRDWCSDREDGM